MVSPLLHHLSHQRRSETVCGTLAHPDLEGSEQYPWAKAERLRPERTPHPEPSRALRLWCFGPSVLRSGSQTRQRNQAECQYMKLSNALCLWSYVNDDVNLIAGKKKRSSVMLITPRYVELVVFLFVSSSPHFYLCWRQACVSQRGALFSLTPSRWLFKPVFFQCL